MLALATLPGTAAAIHNDVRARAEFINPPGTPLSTSFVTSHTNLGDAFNDQADFNRCIARPVTLNFGSSVWYRFHPHRDGRYRAVVQATGGNLRPVVMVHEDTPAPRAVPCNGSAPPLNLATVPPDGFLPVSAGVGYYIQVGGATVSNGTPQEEGGTDPATEGGYTLTLTYDPDSDGDGLFDRADRCDGRAGPGKFLGCPDGDRDGLPDPDDRCPRDNASARDPNRDGCLDLHRLVDSKLSLDETYPGGRVVRFLQILNVPREVRVSIACRRPRGRRDCGSSLVRNTTAASVQAQSAKTIRVGKLRNRRLPYGSKVTISVTKAGATGWYRSYTVVRGAQVLKIVDHCTDVRSTRLRRRGCK